MRTAALIVARDAVGDYIAHVRRQEPMRAIARRRGLQPSTVMRRIRAVEDMRDDPIFDALIAGMEGAAQ